MPECLHGDVDEQDRSGLSRAAILRIALVVFVLAWILGPRELRSAVPIWLVFLVALGLEVHFFVGALRSDPARPPDRGPQVGDRERYGYFHESDDLLLVRRGDMELWIPLADATDEEIEASIDEVDKPLEDTEAPVAAYREGPRFVPIIRRFLVGLGIIGALVLAIWFVETRTGWDALDDDVQAAATARFSDEASLIAEKPVSIRCDEARVFVGTVQHADGVAVVGGDFAYLTPEICLSLYRLAFEGEATGSRTARAIAVLAHEAWHLRGVRDEAETECYGLQSGVGLGQRLGLSEGTARQMMRQQLTENALRGGASLEYRVSPDCRDGGGLDLDPASSQFP
jgi:hypothetical protein